MRAVCNPHPASDLYPLLTPCTCLSWLAVPRDLQRRLASWPFTLCQLVIRLYTRKTWHSTSCNLRVTFSQFTPFSPPNFFFFSIFLSCFSHCIVKSSLSPSGIPLFPSSPSCSPASLPLQSESCRRGLRRSVCLASGLSCYRGLNAMETKFLLHNAGMQVCERGRACTRASWLNMDTSQWGSADCFVPWTPPDSVHPLRVISAGRIR